MLLHNEKPTYKAQNHIPNLENQRDQQEMLAWVSFLIAAVSIGISLYYGRFWWLTGTVVGALNGVWLVYKADQISQRIDDQKATLDGYEKDSRGKPG